MDPPISTTPATARTDGSTLTLPRRERPITPRTVRRLGLTLTTGAVAWATSVFVFGTVNTGYQERIGDLTGLAFQIGVFALLAVQIRTQATGTSRAARAMLKVELVLLGLASTWSLLHGVLPDPLQDHIALAVLDAFWPLSMFGMFVIGVKVAVAGRWRGLLRWWPLVAETWFVATVPTFIILGEDAGAPVGGAHLLVGYATLGVLLALRPHLVLARDDA